MIKDILESLEHIPPDILKKKLTRIMWEGTPDSDALALTFDDGPDPEITPLVIDTLDEAGGRGTFFLLGDQVKKHPGTARMIVERGHLIGNHSMTHPKMFLIGKKYVKREIDDAQKVISDATGVETKLFRPPYGLFDFTCADAVKRRKMSLVLWTVLSGDYSDDPPEKVFNTVEPFIRPGAIQVFHDTCNGGGKNLAGIVRKISYTAREKSIRLGGIDELSYSDFINVDDCND